jgi:predicted ATPase
MIAPAASFAGDQSAWKESALSWQKQAKDTRVVVVGVADELGKTGDKGNADVKGLIEDAVTWLGEGDKNMAAADEAMTKEDYEKASNEYNMAWQYYVKAATAGLNAKSILAGL